MLPEAVWLIGLCLPIIIEINARLFLVWFEREPRWAFQAGRGCSLRKHIGSGIRPTPSLIIATTFVPICSRSETLSLSRVPCKGVTFTNGRVSDYRFSTPQVIRTGP